MLACLTDNKHIVSVIDDDTVDALLVSGLSGLYRVPINYIGINSARGIPLFLGEVDCHTFDPYTASVVFHNAADNNSLKVIDLQDVG